MTRLNATDRMRRLLAVIPWVSGRGEVSLQEIAERFDYPVDRLRRDLTEVVQFVGVHPYTPDMLIEVFLDEENERVRFELADYFTSPLRLTPEEALSLVSAGLGLLGTSVGAQTPLERALNKLAERLDMELGDSLDVSLGGASQRTVDAVIAAAESHHRLRIEYYSLHRGQATERTIEPHHVFSRDGEWYVRAHCHLAEDVRTFRLDRIISLERLGETFDPVVDDGDSTFAPSEDDLRVRLELTADSAWVAEAYPVESLEPLADGGLRVGLAASSREWLERLLLQLGPTAKVVDSTPSLPDGFRGAAAERVLARYRGTGRDQSEQGAR